MHPLPHDKYKNTYKQIELPQEPQRILGKRKTRQRGKTPHTRTLLPPFQRIRTEDTLPEIPLLDPGPPPTPHAEDKVNDPLLNTSPSPSPALPDPKPPPTPLSLHQPEAAPKLTKTPHFDPGPPLDPQIQDIPPTLPPKTTLGKRKTLAPKPPQPPSQRQRTLDTWVHR